MNFKEYWEEIKLGDVIDLQSGYAFKSKNLNKKGLGIPVIKIKNLTPPKISIDDIQYIKNDLVDGLDRYKLKNGDILISMTGSHVNQLASAVGKVSRVQFKDKIFLLNQRIGKFEIKDESKINYDFLYYLVSTDDFRYKLASGASGSANQANISTKQIKSMKVELPSLQEQQKIADILLSLDKKIELNNQMNQTLEDIAQSIYKSWFVDFEPWQGGEFVDSKLGQIPKGWEVILLKDILSLKNGKRPEEKQDEKDKEFQIPVVGASGIMAYAKEELYNEPILVIGRVGTLGVVQRYNYPCWTSDNTIVIKSDYYEYAYHILNNINFKNLNRGSTQPLIAQKDIKGIKVVMPPEEILNEFEVKIKSLFKRISNNKKENKTLIQLRDTLLPKLMSGEIRVPVEE